MFDESFVRAARLRESSARERVSDHAPAVRRRPPVRRGLTRQFMILLLLVAVAFGTAVYLGVRHPYGSAQHRRATEPLRMTVVPLAPRGEVPGAADPEYLYAHSPAAHFEVGAQGIPLPAVRSTAHFSDSQVRAALVIARNYLARSSLDADVLTGRRVHEARSLLDSVQLGQFDRSFDHPAADGRHTPTGWVVRIDPSRARLADDRIRVQGTLAAAEADPGTLEIATDTTFVYALRPARSGTRAPASLLTVRRALTFRFDRDDLRVGRLRVAASTTQAGPLSCAEDAGSYLRPLLSGQSAAGGGPAGTDPYATDSPAALCGTLAAGAQPSV